MNYGNRSREMESPGFDREMMEACWFWSGLLMSTRGLFAMVVLDDSLRWRDVVMTDSSYGWTLSGD